MTPAERTPLGAAVDRWGGRLETVDLDGDAHMAVFAGPEGASATPAVLVHGLGGHVTNWVLLADELRRERDVYAVDLGGHGLTRADVHAPSVGSNAQLVRRFVDEVVLSRTGADEVLLVGNSMGGLVVTLVASRDERGIAGVVLLNPALPAPRSRPHVQARTLATLVRPALSRAVRTRRGTPVTLEEEVERSLRMCVGDWSRMDRDALDAHVVMARSQHGFTELARAQTEAGRTMIAALGRHRVVAERLRRMSVPVLLVHGTEDRLVDVSAARWAAKVATDITYEELSGVGHVPMLEIPAETAEIVRRWEREHVER